MLPRLALGRITANFDDASAALGHNAAAMKARIYQPAKTAMQSGRAKTRKWRLDFEPSEPRKADPLMGWIGSGDTRAQLRLEFESREAAIAYAEKQGLDYVVEEPHLRRVRPKSYADNFRWDRVPSN